jgi:hypothetical protein
MTAGPTLHYSHTNVLWLWFLAVLLYFATCIFWYTIVAGGPVSIGPSELSEALVFDLGKYTVDPISIYEYPWQILVLGILMGILAVSPLLVSQLLSFRYSIPLILSVMFIAKLYSVFIWALCSDQLYRGGLPSVAVPFAFYFTGALHGTSINLLGHLGRRLSS